MIATVAKRTMLVRPPSVPWEHVIERRPEIGVATSSDFEDGDAGRGMRYEHVDETITLVVHKFCDVGRQVDDCARITGANIENCPLHLDVFATEEL